MLLGWFWHMTPCDTHIFLRSVQTTKQINMGIMKGWVQEICGTEAAGLQKGSQALSTLDEPRLIKLNFAGVSCVARLQSTPTDIVAFSVNQPWVSVGCWNRHWNLDFDSNIWMGVSVNGGTPSYHPFESDFTWNEPSSNIQGYPVVIIHIFITFSTNRPFLGYLHSWKPIWNPIKSNKIL